MDIYVKSCLGFTMIIHHIWLCHMTQAIKFKIFQPNFVLNFWEKSQNLLKIGSGANSSRGGKHLPSAYRVNQDFREPL